MNTQRLARDALAGDDDALRMLIETLSPRLIALARGYIVGDAEDVVQEVWMKLLKLKAIMELPENFAGYMAAAVRNTCIDWLRKPRYKAECVSADEYPNVFDGLMASYDNPEELTLASDHAQALAAFVHRLPEMYAVPIRLFYHDEMPAAEIAEMLDLPVSTVKWRLYTGRQLLKKDWMQGGYHRDT